MIYELFGEFEPLIYRIEIAIGQYDIEGARAAIHELSNEMFR
jgi:hypothetical protein